MAWGWEVTFYCTGKDLSSKTIFLAISMQKQIYFNFVSYKTSNTVLQNGYEQNIWSKAKNYLYIRFQ